MSLRSKNPPNVAAAPEPGSIAHPLGTGAATSGSSSQVGSHTNTQHSRQPQRQQQQRYVPYTPRQQRHGAHGQASQPTQLPQPIQFAQPAQSHLSNVKSSAKEIGIETTTVGWTILEQLINEASQAVSSPNASDSNSWGEVWSAIITGKAALLLPREHSSTTSHDQNEKITPEMVKDHLIFIENVSSQRKDRQAITLSGLRGVLNGNTITFRSNLHPTSKLHHALLHPSSRLSAFSHLPPLPQHCHITVPGDPPVPYPSFAISNPPTQHQHQQPTILSIPTCAGIQSKPPLPPRPSPSGRSSVASAHAGSTPAAAATLPGPSSSPSRIPNPFASLFGGKPNVALSTTPSASSSPSMYTTSLPPENVQDGGNVQPGMETTTVDVPVWVIDRTIARNTLGREINAAVYAEIAHALTSKTTSASKSRSGVRSDAIIEENEEREGERGEREEREEREEFDIPEWVLERVNEFVIRLGMYPFVHMTPSTKESHENSRGDGGGGDGTGPSNLTRRLDVAIAGRGAVNAGRRRSRERDRHPAEVEHEGGEYAVANATPGGVEEVAIAIQDFYARLEREVRIRQEKVCQRRRERERSEEEGEGKIERGEEQKEEQKKKDEEVHKLVKRVVEAVETVLCSLFYDRLFMQPGSDDASHDETLASRVAALNVLDLTLEHLDIDVGGAGEELEWVVRACGETLMQLEACHSPADKTVVLVGAHKVVVDGLSKLPPIRLIPEEESRANRAKQQAQAQPKQAPKPPFGAELKEMPSRGSLSPVLPEIAGSQAAGGEETVKEGPPEGTDAKTSKKPPPLPLSPPVSMNSLHPDKPETDNSTKTTTPVSGDLLLPILIFSVAKTNPPHLVSHLLFTQRFRNPVVASNSNSSGEEGYCLVNLMAVAEFLENVDLEALGLIKEGDRPLPSAAELTPIPIVRSPVVAAVHTGGEGKARIEVGALQGTLRGRVEQQVDAIAGSANKVLVGVMDTSFGMLKSLLPGQGPVPGAGIPVSTVVVDSSQPQPTVSPVAVPVTGSAPWSVIKPSFGLLKRENGFSIANIAASLPINRGPKSGEEDGQQMVTVSRPASIRSSSLLERGTGSDDDGVAEEGTGQEEGGEEDSEDGEAHSGGGEEDSPVHQLDDNSVKSIRSFESMMGESGKGRMGSKTPSSKLADGRQKSTSGQDSPVGSIGRKSLTDRLAHMSALAGAKGSPNGSRHGSFVPNANALGIPDVPPRTATSTPQGGPLRVAPPVQRFLECTPDDLRISEVGQLLREYRRLADVIRMSGGFSDEA